MRLTDVCSLGYFKLYLKEEQRAAAYSRLLASGITVASFENYVRIPFGKKRKYEQVLGGLEYEISGPYGAVGLTEKYKRRYGVLAAAVCSVLAFILSSLFVWDVRIDGNCETPDALIENELSEAGLSVGSPWFLLHLDKVESELLEKSESVGWISVNRRGHVAYVTVKEKNESPQAQGSEAVYSNVVATKDCVIDSIVVKKGMPMVKNGDSVKAGDILISGIIPSELGGGFVRAEGEVFGRTTETVGVFVAREETGTVYGEEVLEDKKINFFNFSINIFKNYRNSCNECVIIEETEESLILGKYRLPIQTVSTYSREKLRQSRIYTDSELVSIGKYRLECAKALRLYDAEIMRTVTDASLTEEGYRIESKVTVLRDVAREERIFAEETKT